MIDFDFLREQLPIRIVLPDNIVKPDFYQNDWQKAYWKISDDLYIWLEEYAGNGSESNQPLTNIIKHANWYVEEVEQEYSDMIGSSCRQFAIRFRNKNDASLFKLTWL